jgi:hypothetical protein
MNEEKQSFQDLDEKFSNVDKKFSKGDWDSEKQSNGKLRYEKLNKANKNRNYTSKLDQAKERIWKTEDKGKES